MQSPHIIVHEISAFDPPIDQLLDDHPAPPAEFLRVRFEDGQIAKLEQGDPEFKGRKDMLAGLHRAGVPVYAEVEPESRVIRTLLVPSSGRVVALSRNPEGDVVFHLDDSVKPFTLPAKHPRYRDYLFALREAQIDEVPVLVTESANESAIVDLRRSRNPRPPAPLETATVPAVVPAALRPISPDQAKELFDLVSAQSCDPANPNGLCIPFQYPDDGCHARAHQMCRLIVAAGEQPAKVWNYTPDPQTPLVVKTRNSPKCEVLWVFHVAVAMLVQAPGEDIQIVVLDPSLFPNGPVPVATWRDAQGDPTSCLVYTSPDPYLPPRPAHVDTDPTYKKTVQTLVKYQTLLKHRAGQIPFDCPKIASSVHRP